MLRQCSNGFRQRALEYIDARRRQAAAQFDALPRARHKKVAATGCKERPSNCQDTHAVGVRLDHGTDLSRRRGAELAVVRRQSLQIHAQPNGHGGVQCTMRAGVLSKEPRPNPIVATLAATIRP